MLKKISVVIPSKDKIIRLRLVLKSLEHQVDPNFEVIVVLDGCSQETIDGYESIAWSPLIKTIKLHPNVGRSRARNEGISNATGDIIVFLDDDMIVSPNFLSSHRKYHKQEDEVVVGQMLDIKVEENNLQTLFDSKITSSPYSSLLAYPQENVGKLGNHLFPILKLFKCHWSRLYSCNMSISKKQLDRIGGFSTEFSGWGWEDTELGYRCVRNGLKLVNCHDVEGLHLHHGHNVEKKNIDLRRNYQRFLDMAKGDYIAVSYAWVLDKVQRYIL